MKFRPLTLLAAGAVALLGGCTVDTASLTQAIASIQSAQAQAATQVQTQQGAQAPATAEQGDVAAMPAGGQAQGLVGGTRPQPPQMGQQQGRQQTQIDVDVDVTAQEGPPQRGGRQQQQQQRR